MKAEEFDRMPKSPNNVCAEFVHDWLNCTIPGCPVCLAIHTENDSRFIRAEDIGPTEPGKERVVLSCLLSIEPRDVSLVVEALRKMRVHYEARRGRLLAGRNEDGTFGNRNAYILAAESEADIVPRLQALINQATSLVDS